MYPASLTLIAGFIVAPVLIFHASLVESPWGLLAAALLLAALAPLVARTQWRRPDAGLAALAIGAAVVLTLISGVGHFFYQTDDWTTRDAVLLDLEKNAWPVAYLTDRGVALLRAPLGMYLVPAAVGRAMGTGAGEAALFIQNAALFALCLYAFASSFTDRRMRWIAIPFFVVFSGLDSVAWARRILEGVPDNLLLPHLDPWSGALQFSSHVTQFFWAPNHALAAWANVAAYLAWRSGRLPSLMMGPLWAASIFWSPLAAFGVIPFLLFAFFWDLKDRKVRAVDFIASLAAGVAVLPVLLYFTRDAAAVEKGFLKFGDMDILRSYVTMLLLKALPWLAIAWQWCDRRDRRSVAEFLLILACLVLIPTYSMGYANDFASRVSIPALALLCLRVVPALATLGREPPARRAIVVGCVILAAITPAVEIIRNVRQSASVASACSLVDALKEPPEQALYMAAAKSFDAPAGILVKPAAAPVAPAAIRDCWPGRKFVYAGAGAAPDDSARK
jgi:hypothetical protein